MRAPKTDYARPLPTLPSGAWGFIARRTDRPERLALYSRAGALRCSFAQDANLAEVTSAILATYPGAAVCPGADPVCVVVFNIPAE